MRACVCVYMRACVCVCARARACVCVCVCVCVWGGGDGVEWGGYLIHPVLDLVQLYRGVSISDGCSLKSVVLQNTVTLVPEVW